MVDINLLRDTQDPDAEEKRPDRFQPPKLSDYRAGPGRIPKPTSRAPRTTFLQAVRSFFGIKPKPQGKPRIITQHPASPDSKSASAPVPFRPPASAGSPTSNLPPNPADFTVRPRPVAPNVKPPAHGEPIRGESMIEDIFAEPSTLFEVPRRAPPPPVSPPKAAAAPAPPKSPVPPPKTDDAQALLEDLLKEIPGGAAAKPPLAPPPGKPRTAAPPLPPELPKAGGTTFEPLSIEGVRAAKVKHRAPAEGRFVAKAKERFVQRLQRILRGALPHRSEKLPVGESAEDLDVNLVPEELSAKLNFSDKLISLGFTTLGVIVIIGVAFTALRLYETTIVVNRDEIRAEISGIATKVIELQSTQRDAIAFHQRADAVAFALGNHVRWSHFFTQLSQYTEKDVYFVNFSGDLSGNLTLSAFGPSYESVARQYTTFLSANDFVKTVTIAAAAQNPDTRVVNFTASLQLVPNFYLTPPS